MKKVIIGKFPTLAFFLAFPDKLEPWHTNTRVGHHDM